LLSIVFQSAAAGADALAVGVRPGGACAALAADRAALLRRALAAKHRFKGEEGDVLPVLTESGWVVLLGLGEDDDDDLDPAALRRIGSALFAELAETGIESLEVACDLPPRQAAELAYGMRLRAWRVSAHYRSKPDPDDQWSLTSAVILTDDPEAAKTHFARLDAVALGINLARDLTVAPANELTPQSFADRLTGLFALGIGVELIEAEALARLGLNLLLAVGQGSVHPPLLAVLRWNGGAKNAAPVVLVGKGITFDSGGLDLKEDDDLPEMKGDMAGAATVVGTLAALARRKAAVNAVGILALAENMPSGKAMRPGDVVRGFNGLTVEIIDTDAEGRLVLADALAYGAATFKPRWMIDLATLTGAVEVALGRHKAGLFTADDGLARRLEEAGEAEEEPLWRLPLVDCYDAAIASPIADLRNCAWDDDAPDHLHAARFLQRFVPEGVAWAHLDIAGMAEAVDEDEGEPPPTGPGPTGFGIRLLDHLVGDGAEE